MKIVVKIGGAALEDKSTLRKCAMGIVELARDGHRVAVVHGGGSALTRTLKLLGKQSEFVNGLRVTDAETRDVALMVLAGIVNKSLVAAIGTAGVPAIGLCGGDGMAVPRSQETQPAMTSALSVRSVRLNRAGWRRFGARAAFRFCRRWRSAPTASTTTSMPTRWPPRAPQRVMPTR